MKDLIVEKGDCKLSFSKKIYSFQVILDAAKDFIDSSWIYIDNLDESYFFVYLKSKENLDLETLGREFSNYVLALMQNA